MGGGKHHIDSKGEYGLNTNKILQAYIIVELGLQNIYGNNGQKIKKISEWIYPHQSKWFFAKKTNEK